MTKAFFTRYSITVYFILAYAIAWGGIFLSFNAEGFTIYKGESILTNSFSNQLLHVWLAILAGPSIGGIILTALVDRKRGIKKLFSSMCKVQVDLKWYAASLFIFPVLLFKNIELLLFPYFLCLNTKKNQGQPETLPGVYSWNHFFFKGVHECFAFVRLTPHISLRKIFSYGALNYPSRFKCVFISQKNFVFPKLRRMKEKSRISFLS